MPGTNGAVGSAPGAGLRPKGRRREAPTLRNPHPLGEALPAVYADDEVAQRLTAALDAVVAPAICALDNFAAYLDPALTPPDFLDWLAGWVGVVLDENWPLERRRGLVARLAGLYARRGTVAALAEEVSLYTLVAPEITENGGVTWSSTPGGPLPGRPEPGLTVRVRGADAAAVDPARVEAIVAGAKPAHVPHAVEVDR